mgnify:CR=1 FL=1
MVNYLSYIFFRDGDEILKLNGVDPRCSENADPFESISIQIPSELAQLTLVRLFVNNLIIYLFVCMFIRPQPGVYQMKKLVISSQLQNLSCRISQMVVCIIRKIII